MARAQARKKTQQASASKRARRTATAEKLVAGKPVSEIAHETGVSRATAYRDAASAEVQFRVARALDRHAEKLEALLGKMLDRLSQALDARRPIIVSMGEGVQEIRFLKDPLLGADHAVRVKAAAQIQRLFILGRPLPQSDGGSNKPITLAEFERLLQTYLGART